MENKKQQSYGEMIPPLKGGRGDVGWKALFSSQAPSVPPKTPPPTPPKEGSFCPAGNGEATVETYNKTCEARISPSFGGDREEAQQINNPKKYKNSFGQN